ncbi:hypothetical protein [Singulisphaera acidiphila]|uniref:hypothetical protein n=1 Tax=Singulisphaera acidiphila TaxID=466153 RepID=UPI0003154D94|nr:hypothetical protein [Singulisphaera acidiphila]
MIRQVFQVLRIDVKIVGGTEGQRAAAEPAIGLQLLEDSDASLFTLLPGTCQGGSGFGRSLRRPWLRTSPSLHS